MTVNVAVLGNPVLDRVLVDGVEQAVTVGGSAGYAGAALARLGARVRVTGGIGGDFPAAQHLALARWGLELEHLFRAPEVASTAYQLEYRSDRAERFVRRREPGPRILAAHLPPDLAGMHAVHCGAVAGELTAEALDRLLALSPRPLLGADLHLIRQFDGTGRVTLRADGALRARLEQMDVLKGSFAEIRALAGTGDVAAALEEIAAREVVLATDGAGRGLFRQGEVTRSFAPYPVDEEDATGAGDVFLAGYLFARVALARGIEDAVRFAAAAASFVVEHRGVAGLGDLAAVTRRAEAIRID